MKVRRLQRRERNDVRDQLHSSHPLSHFMAVMSRLETRGTLTTVTEMDCDAQRHLEAQLRETLVSLCSFL